MGSICSSLCNLKEEKQDKSTCNLYNHEQIPLIDKKIEVSNNQNENNKDKKENDKSIENHNNNSDNKEGKLEGPQEISFKDFEKIQTLGSGAYGDVILVKKKSNNKQFAMKIIKKSKIIERRLSPSILIEKNVLLENKHPFLVRLKYSFQSDKKFYLVMEYCQGGELYTYLVNSKKFSLEVSRFIAAEVVLGMEYLHTNMKIIYRDLKPENVMVSEDGHLKITDFGLSKQLKTETELTKSLRGTPEYIAPEVIQATRAPKHPGYGLQCDIWAFGVFLYEIVSGSPPFIDKNRNWVKIMTKIIENKPAFSSDFSDECQDLIRKCLRNQPSSRPSWEEIKQHAFFESINWEALLNKELESPLKQLIPKRNGATQQRSKPIFESSNSEVFDQLQGYTYDPNSLQNDKVI